MRQKPPQVLLNVPPEELPAPYVKVTHKPDLTKIKALLKGDTEGAIDWASLFEEAKGETNRLEQIVKSKI